MTPLEAISEMIEAVRIEMDAVRRKLQDLDAQLVPLENGVRRIAEPGAHEYGFDCEIEFHIPDGTSFRLDAGGVPASGETLDHDAGLGRLRCVVREDLGARVPSARLTFDSTTLLRALQARLESLAAAAGTPRDGLPTGTPSRLHRALAFLTGTAPRRAPVPVEDDRLSAAQRRAVEHVLGQEVAYLWGPPGTGKTQTLASLVHALVDRGERVLLAAHTNVATDTALARVLDERALREGEVVRVGWPTESIRGRGVSLDEVVTRALVRDRSDLLVRIEELYRRVEQLVPAAPWSERTPPTRRLAVACGQLADVDTSSDPELPALARALQQEIQQIERAALFDARVVAATLTRIYTSRAMRDLVTEALVVDEASIASLATCFVAATTASRRAIAVGDFMQLPAIVHAEQPTARKWLGWHVFASAGCDSPERDHPLRVMLDEQWRMHPQIARVVSRCFYAGRLRNAPAVLHRAHPGPAVLLLDTSALPCSSESSASGSKRNPAHARLVAELVRLSSTPEIAVIAPYRAQVRAIRDAVRAVRPELLAKGLAEIFTVHRFQGRDKDLVVFDLVEAPGTRCRFLDERSNPDAAKLVNVALSRARERVVIVAHLEHLDRALGRHSQLPRVFATVRAAGGLELEAGHEADRDALARFLGGGD